MKHTILALTSLYPENIDDLLPCFEVIKAWQESDLDAVINKRGADIDGVIALPGKAVDAATMDKLPNLKIISNFSVGTDHVDLMAAKERGVMVSNTPDVLTEDTADTALALMLAVMRRVCEGDGYVRTGAWGTSPFPLGTALSGRKCGIVGLGRIGKAIAKRAEAFGMEISYYGRSEKSDTQYKFYSDLNKLAQDSDVIILSCAGGEETKHLINKEVLENMHEKAFLVNVSRGTVVDEDALLTVLKNKKIAGAGLDVYMNEPHINPAFAVLDNVVLLPHIGSATTQTRSVMAHLVADNIKAFFDGKPLLTAV